MVHVTNAANVTVPVKATTSFKFNQHALARDNCDALAIYSLSRYQDRDYHTIVVTGAKWKNIQNIVATRQFTQIIAFNPTVLAGDR